MISNLVLWELIMTRQAPRPKTNVSTALPVSSVTRRLWKPHPLPIIVMLGTGVPRVLKLHSLIQPEMDTMALALLALIVSKLLQNQLHAQKDSTLTRNVLLVMISVYLALLVSSVFLLVIPHLQVIAQLDKCVLMVLIKLKLQKVMLQLVHLTRRFVHQDSTKTVLLKVSVIFAHLVASVLMMPPILVLLVDTAPDQLYILSHLQLS
mmetsp:Transcript_62220/g.85951  ORF Transcript_62220/g.85951 Transcript_62220/m.85951 type:complete len:207 (+) Transcript_62220:4661-5281(+)